MGDWQWLSKATGNRLALGTLGSRKPWKALPRSGGGTCQHIITAWSESGAGHPHRSHSDTHLPAMAALCWGDGTRSTTGYYWARGPDRKKHPMFSSAEAVFAAGPSPPGNPICWSSCRPQSCDSEEVRGNTRGREDSTEELKSLCEWLQHLREPRCLTSVTYFLHLEC